MAAKNEGQEMFDHRETSAPPTQDRDAAAMLSPGEAEKLRSEGVELGFDPALNTWVRLDRVEDRTRQMFSGMAPPDELALRPWTGEDAATYAALLDDPAVWEYLYEEYPAPMTDALARDLIGIAAAPHHLVRAALAEGEAVGQIRLLPDASGTEAELSYWLGRAHWGKGIGKRMVQAALRFGFAELGSLRRIVAYVHPDNRASQHLLTRSGFTPVPPRADGWLAFGIERP